MKNKIKSLVLIFSMIMFSAYPALASKYEVIQYGSHYDPNNPTKFLVNNTVSATSTTDVLAYHTSGDASTTLEIPFENTFNGYVAISVSPTSTTATVPIVQYEFQFGIKVRSENNIEASSSVMWFDEGFCLTCSASTTATTTIMQGYAAHQLNIAVGKATTTAMLPIPKIPTKIMRIRATVLGTNAALFMAPVFGKELN